MYPVLPLNNAEVPLTVGIMLGCPSVTPPTTVPVLPFPDESTTVVDPNGSFNLYQADGPNALISPSTVGPTTAALAATAALSATFSVFVAATAEEHEIAAVSAIFFFIVPATASDGVEAAVSATFSAFVAATAREALTAAVSAGTRITAAIAHDWAVAVHVTVVLVPEVMMLYATS